MLDAKKQCYYIAFFYSKRQLSPLVADKSANRTEIDTIQ